MSTCCEEPLANHHCPREVTALLAEVAALNAELGSYKLTPEEETESERVVNLNSKEISRELHALGYSDEDQKQMHIRGQALINALWSSRDSRNKLVALQYQVRMLREALSLVTPRYEKFMMLVPTEGDIQVLQKCVAALSVQP